MMEGKITGISAAIVNGKLTVSADVECDEGIIQASLPDREKAALVPRSILLGEQTEAGESRLPEIQEILDRLTLGRRVRMWEYRNIRYCAFLPWKDVKFICSEGNSSSVA